jgi:DNA-directed RNA polymerase subunit RPC12/RpoP
MEPFAAAPDRDGVVGVRCPWCGADRVERISIVGPQLMSESYLCLACHSPFERIKR